MSAIVCQQIQPTSQSQLETVVTYAKEYDGADGRFVSKTESMFHTDTGCEAPNCLLAPNLAETVV